VVETWQIVGLIWVAGALALVLPGMRRRLAGQPALRWAALWLAALLGLMLAYELLLAVGIDLTPARRP
jgi:hypothetical protein